MKIILFLLILSGQFSFGAEEGCEKRLGAPRLRTLIEELARDDSGQFVSANILLQTNAVAAQELWNILALQKVKFSHSYLTLNRVSPADDALHFEFSVTGLSSQVRLILEELEDSGRLNLAAANWSVLNHVTSDSSTSLPSRPLLVPIEDLELPLTAKAVFSGSSKFRYAGDLAAISEEQALKIRGVGPGLLRHIKLGLAGVGLSFGMNLPDWPKERQGAIERIQQIANSEARRKITEFGFSVRTLNSLKNDNIWFLGDLLVHNEQQISRIPGIARKSVSEIKEKLTELGLHLGMDVPGWPYDDLEPVSN